MYQSFKECEAICNTSSIIEPNVEVSIYPNPSSYIFNVKVNSLSETQISVTKILGEQVYFESAKFIGEFHTQIHFSNCSKEI